MTADFRAVSVDLIRPNPHNPRSAMAPEQLADLVESVRERGILQPLLLRPAGEGLEVVCGHRRLEAALQAGLGVVPAVIRELTDQEALQIQLTENLQRADLHPLEEAAGYRRLIDEFRLLPADIAIKVGKSPAYVHTRLRFAELPQGARELFLAGQLTPSTALLITRIPRPDLAEKAAKEIVHRGTEPMTTRQASDWIREHYMLHLSGAQFDTHDETLTTAGACQECLKRSGAQRDLFDDLSSDDICTDPVCFNEKRNAHWKRVAKAAKADGVQVLSKNEGKSQFQFGRVRWDSQYLAGNEKQYVGSRQKTVSEICRGEHIPRALAQNPDTGEVVELFDKAAVQKLVNKKRRQADQKDKSGTEDKKSAKEERAAAKAQEERSRLITARLNAAKRAAIVDAVEDRADPLDHKLVEVLARAGLSSLINEETEEVLDRRRIPVSTGDPETILLDLLPNQKTSFIFGLLVELLLVGNSICESDLAEGLGIDIGDALIESVTAEVDAELASAPQPEKKRRGRRQKSQPAEPHPEEDPDVPTCRVCGCTDDDCRQCVEAQGEPCYWVESDLCSRCAAEQAEQPQPATKRRGRPRKAKPEDETDVQSAEA